MDALDFLGNFRSFLITSHLSPDGDAIGSEIALYLFLKDLGRDVFIVNDEPVPEIYRFLDGSKAIQTITEFRYRHADMPFEAVIFLECSNKHRAGQVGKLAADKPVLNIDHHSDNALYGNVNLVHGNISACGEIIHDMILKGNGRITGPIASALYTAILTDTSFFRFHATGHTFQIASSLVENGADPAQIAEQVYEQVSFLTMLLLGKCLATLTQAMDGLVTYCRVSRKMYEETGTREADSEGFIDYLRVIADSKITFILKELPNGKTRVNLRSKQDYDVQKVAAVFSGGGHLNAAGCTIDAPIDQAEKMVLSAIEKQSRSNPRSDNRPL